MARQLDPPAQPRPRTGTGTGSGSGSGSTWTRQKHPTRRHGLYCRAMKFMRHFKSSSKLRQKEKDLHTIPKHHDAIPLPTWHPTAPDYTSRLDTKILRRIFALVCPHTRDESYESQEESMVGDGCMLCDLRDLSNCCLVKRAWYGPASGLLYHSVRIDAVHFCELEEYLADKRQRRSYRGRNADVPDPPTLRLQQLQRTLWNSNKGLGQVVKFLKTPYMTREICKAELARCVSVTPNLKYIDLPDGCYSGESTSATLMNELKSRCSGIRQMKYRPGAELNFEQLEQGYWPELEILDLSGIQIVPGMFRKVMGCFRHIRELRISDANWFGDEIFRSARGIPEFPALTTLILTKVPVTIDGLTDLLRDPRARENLTSLTLSKTHIKIEHLHRLLQAASDLEHLSVTDTVSMALPLDPIPPLTSISLRTLHYEILSASDNPQSLQPPAASYYSYLQSSLQSNKLPALRVLYVRDASFPETLLLTPPTPAFAPAPAPQLRQPLEVYAKDPSALEWVFTTVLAADVSGRRGSISGGRPISQYDAQKGLGPQWGGDARRSVVVGNGFGGFLAVPAEEGIRPSSRGSAFGGSPATSPMRASFGLERPPERSSVFGGLRGKRDSRADLWR